MKDEKNNDGMSLIKKVLAPVSLQVRIRQKLLVKWPCRY